MAKITITIDTDSGITEGQDGSQTAVELPAAAAYSPGSNIAANRLGSSYYGTRAPAAGGGGPGPIGSGGGGPGPIGSPDIRTLPLRPPGGQGPVGPGSGGPGPIDSGSGGPGPIDSGSGGAAGAFALPRQQQVEWCWAAIAVGVEKYFDPSSTLRQCDVASSVTGNQCCGLTGSSAGCNQPEKLQDALADIGRLRSVLQRPLQFQEVQREIDAGRPICARVAWDSGGAHFVLLDGYRILSSGARHVHVSDPLNPSSEVDFDEFNTNYHGDGQWTGTYLVRSM